MDQLKEGPRRASAHLIHEGCGGFFVFDKLKEERTCSSCCRKESYEIYELILIGQRGTSEKELRSICEAIRIPVIKVERDKSHPETLAVTVRLPREEGKPPNLDTWAIILEKKERHIRAACKKLKIDIALVR